MRNKIAFITGTSAGIGEATANLLATQGFDLILTGRRKERIEQLAHNLATLHGIKTLALVFDVRNHEEVKDAIEGLSEYWKNIDVLVNNAGLASGLASLVEGNVNDWETMIDTNVKGLLYVSKYVLPLLKNKGQGHVINIGSIAGKEVYVNGNVYCATKHAVDAISKGMRIELAPFGVKVTAIHPGAVETEFSIVRFHGNEEKAKKVYEGFENLIATDIAEAIWFCINRPFRVNINELIIMPTAQPMASIINRKP
ncbi:MAG: SDR family NAD(P)-dependent oxidoreductase [Sphingobacteriales bacterium]|nr:SDR family NAD(P)-dependent oxidoreductase [Sphingobacteriales bacterium]